MGWGVDGKMCRQSAARQQAVSRACWQGAAFEWRVFAAWEGPAGPGVGAPALPLACPMGRGCTAEASTVLVPLTLLPPLPPSLARLPPLWAEPSGPAAAAAWTARHPCVREQDGRAAGPLGPARAATPAGPARRCCGRVRPAAPRRPAALTLETERTACLNTKLERQVASQRPVCKCMKHARMHARHGQQHNAGQQ